VVAGDAVMDNRVPRPLVREARFPRWAKVLAGVVAYFVAHSILSLLRMLFPSGW
jgi:hypothetical protein